MSLAVGLTWRHLRSHLATLRGKGQGHVDGRMQSRDAADGEESRLVGNFNITLKNHLIHLSTLNIFLLNIELGDQYIFQFYNILESVAKWLHDGFTIGYKLTHTPMIFTKAIANFPGTLVAAAAW